jgi:hypothetical protein
MPSSAAARPLEMTFLTMSQPPLSADRAITGTTIHDTLLRDSRADNEAVS